MYEYDAKIIRVVDGDTVDALVTLQPQRLIQMDNTPGLKWWDFGFYFYAPNADAYRLPFTIQRFRLLAMDAPEVRGIERPEGLVATAALKELIEREESRPGGQIKIQSEKQGKYGRYLGTLFTEFGLNLNEEMIRLGHATEYPS
jgi:micrococcal nuclease